MPHFREGDEWLDKKYTPVKDAEDEEEVRKGHPKTFNHLACEERHTEDGETFVGKVAIAALKGDVDNLGTIFQQGLSAPTFAKMAALSRQMNHFFSLWLPAFCAEKYPDTYTVFAGGDDFFLIGPWLRNPRTGCRNALNNSADMLPKTQRSRLAQALPSSTLGLPPGKLSAYAEEALEAAKAYPENET